MLVNISAKKKSETYLSLSLVSQHSAGGDRLALMQAATAGLSAVLLTWGGKTGLLPGKLVGLAAACAITSC